jgi:hypothetical protein
MSEKDRIDAISLYGLYGEDLEAFLADAVTDNSASMAEQPTVDRMAAPYVGTTAVAQSAEMPPAVA